MISSLINTGHPRKYSYEILHETFTEQPLLENMKFLRGVTFWNSYLFGGGVFQNTIILRRSTFSKQVLRHRINFFRRVIFWKMLVFQKSNILRYLHFLEKYLIIAATFSKDVTFDRGYIFRKATFSKELLFHSYNSFPQPYFLYISQ